MSNEQKRAEFEREYGDMFFNESGKKHGFSRDSADEYSNEAIQECWLMWQIALDRATSGAASGEVVEPTISAEMKDGVIRVSCAGLKPGKNYFITETDSDAYVAPAEQSAPPVPLTSIATGYEGGVCVSDSGGLGGSIHLHYESLAEAESAFDVITDAIDEDRRCRVQGGITNDSDSNSLATQSTSTAPGQEETERDAARYRFLRDNGVPDDEGDPDDALLVYKGFGESSLLPDELDVAIDSAIAALSKEKP